VFALEVFVPEVLVPESYKPVLIQLIQPTLSE